MSDQSIWNYPIGRDATKGKANLPAWQRLSWINHDTKLMAAIIGRHDDGGTKDRTKGDIYTRVCYIDKRVREMRSIVDQQSKQIADLKSMIQMLVQGKQNDEAKAQ